MTGDERASAPDTEEAAILATLERDVTLAQGATQGAAWLGSSRVVAQIFQFFVSLITARLLLPAEFGEAALVLAVAAFAVLFTDLGLAPAIVHTRRATEEILATAFWLNFGTGVALTLLLSALAYPLSLLYGQPSLLPLMVLASANFTLSASVVQTALLERTFNYRPLATRETAAQLVGIGSMPIAAAAGMGAESLVLGPLVTTILRTTFLWLRVPWRPHTRPTKRAALELWRFARGLMGFNTVNYWSRNVDTLLLGGTVSTAALGQYNRAYTLTAMPVQQMSQVVARVLFPALTRLRDEPRRLGRAWMRSISAAALITFPATITLTATAPALVPVLYGSRWNGTVPILQLLGIASIPQIIGASSGAVYRAVGRTGLLFRVGLINALLGVVAILAGLPWGTHGVATGVLIQSFVGLPIAVGPIARHVGFPVRELLPVVKPCIALAAGEFAVRWLAPDSLAAWEMLVLQLAAGGLLFVLVLARTNPDALRSALEVGRRVRSRLRTRAKAAT